MGGGLNGGVPHGGGGATAIRTCVMFQPSEHVPAHAVQPLIGPCVVLAMPGVPLCSAAEC